ncbi:MAG: ROK family protein [Chloroflexota bacterium]|nr:ROK family protein [Chloroflexota bacterium]
MEILGIDIGGTGIKGAPVDTEQGTMLTERFRVLTPQPATPEAVAESVAHIVEYFNWRGEIGAGYPGVVKDGYTLTAANVDPGWIGAHASALLEHVTGCPVSLVNDADAAGLAEMRFGAGRGQLNTVFMLTVGTGIGTALFVNGQLVPNTELGHLLIRGKDAEQRASEKVRVEKELSWKSWARRFNEYLVYLDNLFWPDMFIIGGGVSKYFSKFSYRLTVRARVVPAELQNDAGIVGAAMARIQS